MKKFKQFLSERKQVGRLYHFTPVLNAISILTGNFIKGGSTQSEYVSFTRDKNFLKTANRESEIQSHNPLAVCFEVDGNKISDNYKIEPYSYKNEYPKAGVSDESEERVKVKDKIENFNKYIVKIKLYKKKLSEYATFPLLLPVVDLVMDTTNSYYSDYQGKFLEGIGKISNLLNIPTGEWFDPKEKDLKAAGKTEKFEKAIIELLVSEFEKFTKKHNFNLEIIEG